MFICVFLVVLCLCSHCSTMFLFLWKCQHHSQSSVTLTSSGFCGCCGVLTRQTKSHLPQDVSVLQKEETQWGFHKTPGIPAMLGEFFFVCLFFLTSYCHSALLQILTHMPVLCRQKKQVLMIFWTFLPVSLQRWITESLNIIIYILVKFSSKTEDESLLDIWASIHITAVLTQCLSAGSLQCLLHM